MAKLKWPNDGYRHTSKAAQLCSTLCDPMDCSPPGSSLHGIFQARLLEWAAISFSNISTQSLSINSILIFF